MILGWTLAKIPSEIGGYEPCAIPDLNLPAHLPHKYLQINPVPIFFETYLKIQFRSTVEIHDEPVSSIVLEQCQHATVRLVHD